MVDFAEVFTFSFSFSFFFFLFLLFYFVFSTLLPSFSLSPLFSKEKTAENIALIVVKFLKELPQSLLYPFEKDFLKIKKQQGDDLTKIAGNIEMFCEAVMKEDLLFVIFVIAIIIIVVFWY